MSGADIGYFVAKLRRSVREIDALCTEHAPDLGTFPERNLAEAAEQVCGEGPIDVGVSIMQRWDREHRIQRTPEDIDGILGAMGAMFKLGVTVGWRARWEEKR